MRTWLECRCKAKFTAEDENMAWELHRSHAQSMAAIDDGGWHDVVASGKPLTYPEPPPVDLAETINWMAQTVHQAYHSEEAGGYDTCPRSICTAATRALKVNGHEVSMPGVLPAVLRAPSNDSTDPGAHAQPSSQAQDD